MKQSIIIVIIGLAAMLLLAWATSTPDKMEYNPPKKKKAKTEDVRVVNGALQIVSSGTVPYVEKYLKDNLNDAQSYEPIEWSDLVDIGNGMTIVKHKYRAKNEFGASVININMFYLDQQGKVVSVTPANDN
jgi:ABC-type molybdate transport system substrate-binding protein